MTRTRKKTAPAAIVGFGAGAAAQLHGTEHILTGRDWRAAERLTTKDRQVLAEIGETCERVPPTSWSWLIEQEIIRPLACTCPPGVPRQPNPACPVDHATWLAALCPKVEV